MKQGILIIFLITTLLTAAFFEQKFIEESFAELKERVKIFEELILQDKENIATEQNKESINELITFWENKEKTLFMFLSHQHLQDISNQLYTSKIAVDFNDSEKVLIAAELILTFIKDYADFAIVSWQSIF